MRHATRVSVLGLALAVTACGSSTTGPGDNGGNGGGSGLTNNIVNPTVFEAFLRNTWLNMMAGISGGLDRALDNSKGFPVQGVAVLSQGPNGFEALVDVDLDGDGALEASVRVNVSGSISAGGAITISEISAPGIPSYVGDITATVSETSLGVLQFENIGGDASMDEPGSENAADISTTGGSVEFDFDAATTTGFLDCLISGEGQQLVVRLTLQADGRVRVTGDGVDFTVP